MPDAADQPPTRAVVDAAAALGVDARTREAVHALHGAGIETVLLKGPTLDGWIYPPGTPRTYQDSDLLVAPADLKRAEAVVSSLGYERAPRRPEDASDHAQLWVRPGDRGMLDLHWTLFGVGVPPEEVWRVLSTVRTPVSVGDAVTDALDPAGRVLSVALHAAQHGPDSPKQLRDLDYALERVPEELWRQAAELAARLDATHVLAQGLRLRPAGSRLADRLNLVDAAVVQAALHPNRGAPLALGFDRLARASTTREKARIALRELFPSPAYMRWSTPLARRGRAGLVVAYPWRLAWILRHAAPSLRAWRRAGR